jgi:hypothetical protein
MCAQSANIVMEEGSHRNLGKLVGVRQDRLGGGFCAAADGTRRLHIIMSMPATAFGYCFGPHTQLLPQAPVLVHACVPTLVMTDPHMKYNI